MKKKLLILASISLFALGLASCNKKVEDDRNKDKEEEKIDDQGGSQEEQPKDDQGGSEEKPNDDQGGSEEQPKDDQGGSQEEQTGSKIYDKDGNLLLELTTTYYEPIAGKLDNKEDFKKNLHALIEQSHTKHLTYKECWDGCEKADEDPNNSKNIVCIYSGESILKTNHVGSAGQKGQWNREHLYPQSKGFKSNDAIAHNDIHHLRAAEYTTNSSRGDTDFGEGGLYYTPRAEVRGDIARALLYMTVRYEIDDYTSYTYNGRTYTDSDDLDLELSSSKGDNKKPYTGSYYLSDLYYLIKWNYEDPVDDVERKRNDVVAGLQGNRNPFIDYNEFVAYLYPEFAKEYIDIKNIEYLL